MPAAPDRPALFRAFPQLASALPWLPLGSFPTPVERLAALGRSAGQGELWIKRDDRSGLPYGGNKVRKLEFLLADVKRRGCRRIVTMGAFGSHQILATTLYAARAGLSVCGLVFPQPATEHARDTLMLSLGAGACLHPAFGLAGIPVAGLRCLWQHRHAGPWAWVGPGGSSPLGTLGYVSAALELAEQVAAGVCPVPEDIVVPFGSGGTAAGLAVGLRLVRLFNNGIHLLNKSQNLLNKRQEVEAGDPPEEDRTSQLLSQSASLFNKSQVVAVRVYDRFFSNAGSLARLANRTAALLRRAGGPDAGHFRASDFRVVHQFFGGAYGRPTPEALAAAERARAEEGLILETTYTAKALAAILAAGPSGRHTLFWNTFSSAPTAALRRADPVQLPPRLFRMIEPR